MAWHNTLGKLGEEKVRHYLLEKGCTILEQNWRLGRIEVDFIILDGQELVVVEVKTRRRPDDYPGELLSRGKCKRLLVAGAAYLERHRIKREIRFDLIIVSGKEMKIEHLRDAIRV
ncbi:MAG: YraN family protein [Odoribacteraceae bacterium]|jgi:putative endonuclease|nr:YraN family protein [Odoribacteraceae bacterium]